MVCLLGVEAIWSVIFSCQSSRRTKVAPSSTLTFLYYFTHYHRLFQETFVIAHPSLIKTSQSVETCLLERQQSMKMNFQWAKLLLPFYSLSWLGHRLYKSLTCSRLLQFLLIPKSNYRWILYGWIGDAYECMEMSVSELEIWYMTRRLSFKRSRDEWNAIYSTWYSCVDLMMSFRSFDVNLVLWSLYLRLHVIASVQLTWLAASVSLDSCALSNA